MAEAGPHRARRRFGQNFLADATVVRRIVAAIDPRPGERIVEIGPGLGVLTAALLERVPHITAIEIDRDLVARLRERFPATRLTLIEGDALRYDFAAAGPSLRVVGNLPYNISTPLLFRLLEDAHALHDIHVMLQREVVERMTATPGSSAYGRLTVMLGYRFAIEKLMRVAPGAFRPPPKVESAVARLRPLRPLPVEAHDEALFRRLVAAAFAQRRKTLRNALHGLADETLMRGAGIDERARGETLSIAQYAALANAISGKPSP